MPHLRDTALPEFELGEVRRDDRASGRISTRSGGSRASGTRAFWRLAIPVTRRDHLDADDARRWHQSCQAAGYDPATQLLLIDPPTMPAIPDRPTREDAEAALALLKDLSC